MSNIRESQYIIEIKYDFSSQQIANTIHNKKKLKKLA